MENFKSNKKTPVARSPLGTINMTTPSQRRAKKELSKEVVATDDGRASVQKLSEWLTNESSKKQQRTLRSNQSNAATTPVRFRTTPKLKKEDVAATNDKRVSVKTLSSWMSDDPFDQKKVRHIRSGAKVIAKSRIFEPQTTKISMNIEAGSVQNKKEWLNEAFKSSETNKRTMPSSEARPYQLKKQKKSPEKEVNSVKDKKEWLSNAFKDNKSRFNKHGDIQKSKSVDSGDSINVSRDETAIVKSSSVDDSATMCSQSTHCGEKCVASASGVDRTYTDEEKGENAVSVKDRAQWLQGAFDKKSGC